MRVGELVAEFLEHLGVATAFGIISVQVAGSRQRRDIPPEESSADHERRRSRDALPRQRSSRLRVVPVLRIAVASEEPAEAK